MPARKLTLKEFDQALEALAQLAPKRAAVGVADSEAARYARVLEYGSIVGQPPWPKPGPRTVLAIDPETGAQVVVSAQAPQGFIRVRVPEFLEALQSRLATPVDWLNSAAVENHLAATVGDAAADALEALRAAVPRDSGKLAESLAMTTE
jgi:hypothetical protein